MAPVVWYVEPYAGGPGIGHHPRGYHLCEQWRSRGFETHVFCGSSHHLLERPRPPDSACDTEAGRYHFIALPPYDGNGLGRLRNMLAFGPALRRYVRRHAPPSPDVLIYSSPHIFAAHAARRIARRAGARFVFEVRDLWPLSLIEITGAHAAHPVVVLASLREREAYRHSDAVVSLLPAALEHMVDRGLDPDRWHCIPNGVALGGEGVAPPAAPDPDDELVRWANARRREGRRVLVYTGALGVPNGMHRLIEAAASLDEATAARLQLLVIGRGTEAARLESLAIELGIPCRFHGQMPKDRVLGLLNACDGGFISLVPSPVFRFGVSPNKIFDYMNAGLPVISAIDAGNDPVREADCGWSVRSDSRAALAAAIGAWLDASPETLETFGENGRRWVREHHDYASLARRYEALFEVLLGSSRRAA